MTKYSVQIPVTGSVIVTVDADSPDDAKEKAWNLADFRVIAENNACDIGEFETHEKVSRGNVCYAVCHELNIEEVE